MSFILYRPHADILHRAFIYSVRQQRKSKDRRKRAAARAIDPYALAKWDALGQTYTALNLDLKVDGDILAAEYIHEEFGSNLVFVPSKSFCDLLYQSQFSVEPEAFEAPCGGACAFAFPEDLILDGIQVKPMLFSAIDRDVWVGLQDKFVRMMKGCGVDDKALGLNGKVVTLQFDGLGEKNHHLPADFYSPKVHLMIQANRISSILAGEASMREVFDEIKSEMEVERPEIRPYGAARPEMLDVEIRMHYVFFRLAAALCVYLRAFPDALHEGAPGDYEVENKWRSPGTVRTLAIDPRLQEDVDRAAGGDPTQARRPHWRRWTWMSLAAPRYHRNDDGSIRTVFRRGGFVGLKAQVHHVEPIPAMPPPAATSP